MINSVNEIMVGLLRAAQCPACDGSGTIAIQVRKYDYDLEQCQWCYERDLVLSHFDKIEEKECKKIAIDDPDNIPF